MINKKTILTALIVATTLTSSVLASDSQQPESTENSSTQVITDYSAPFKGVRHAKKGMNHDQDMDHGKDMGMGKGMCMGKGMDHGQSMGMGKGMDHGQGMGMGKCKNMKGQNKSDNSELSQERKEFREKRHAAILEIKAQEVDFFKSLEGMERTEAEKRIDEFYEKAFASLPMHTNKRQEYLINEIEKLDIDKMAKEMVIDKLKKSNQPTKHQSFTKNKSISFAKRLLNLTPEERTKAIAERDQKIEKRFNDMRKHGDNKHQGNMSKGKKCSMNNKGGHKNNNGGNETQMQSLNNIQSRQITINYNNCQFFTNDQDDGRDGTKGRHHKMMKKHDKLTNNDSKLHDRRQHDNDSKHKGMHKRLMNNSPEQEVEVEVIENTNN